MPLLLGWNHNLSDKVESSSVLNSKLCTHSTRIYRVQSEHFCMIQHEGSFSTSRNWDISCQSILQTPLLCWNCKIFLNQDLKGHLGCTWYKLFCSFWNTILTLYTKDLKCIWDSFTLRIYHKNIVIETCTSVCALMFPMTLLIIQKHWKLVTQTGIG